MLVIQVKIYEISSFVVVVVPNHPLLPLFV